MIKVDDPEPARTEVVTVAGKYCESTDILVAGAETAPLATGDVICLPATGAYCLAMASNYNGMPRPEVVMVHDGAARVIRRRESLAIRGHFTERLDRRLRLSHLAFEVRGLAGQHGDQLSLLLA